MTGSSTLSRGRSQPASRAADVLGEHARVVAEAVDRGRARAGPALADPLRARRRVPREVHTRQRDALPERGQRGDAAVVDGHQPELGEVEQRRLEAGGRDHVVGAELERPVPGRPVSDDPEAVRVALDPLDRHVEDVRARPAARVLVVGVQVADAQGREGKSVHLHRPRGAEDDAARPRKQALSDLEARVPLADDEDLAVGVRLRARRVDVVRGVLEPRNRRPATASSRRSRTRLPSPRYSPSLVTSVIPCSS